MNAVGRLGSYISRGVYSVSAPFHPFGGAVDIIVVEQQDGSFKSSPWYVRFGKFQGVLKSKENIVKISVNGVEANFHMHLNNTGQAHFLREVDDDEVEDRTEAAIRTCSSVEEMKNYSQDYKKSLKSKSCDFGVVLDSAQGGPGFDRFNSLQCSEVAAQHLEVQWTASLATNACKDADEVSHCSAPGSLEDDKYDSDMQVCHEMDLSHKKEDIITDDQQGIDEGDVSFLSRNSSEEEETLTDRVQCLSCVKTAETEDITLEKLAEDIKKKEEEDSQQTTVSHACDETDLEGSTTTLLSFDQSVSLDRLSVSDREDFVDGNLFRGQKFTSESSLENQFLFSDLDEPKLNERRLSVSSRFSDGIESICTKDDGCVTPDTSDNENQSTNAGHFHGEPRAILKPINGERRRRTGSGKMIGLAESVPNMPSHFDSFNARDTDNSLSQSLSLKSHSLKLPLPRNDKRSTKPCARKENRIMQTRPSPEETKISGNANSIMGEGANLPEPKVTKKTVEVLTPTSEQISSLNLKEGGNAVTLTFCTEMLGDQQVDARIYLWKWNARIIISDVDGTITKSDILGQCMPLVGIDWSQAGVARLFQAVKENGYELLFLSARSISQAHLTRQFLVNLKQDGMALPDGPVLISPDGLFPSLYREVIKRAPHEFKIACLEDIKALFPSDHSPFYAGFGNRDTDEISYLKVGIPKGKIFIINPKGEVVVNRHVHTKSYTSIHGLVNGMFPPVTSSEQEDFNSWNFWRLPPTNMNL